MTHTHCSPDIVERLNAHCVGHPYAQIEWPHRLLHDARDEIERLRAQAATPSKPVAWVIPGDDNAKDNGFLDAMAWSEGEFTRPLYAHPHDAAATPTHCDNCGAAFKPDDDVFASLNRGVRRTVHLKCPDAAATAQDSSYDHGFRAGVAYEQDAAERRAGGDQ